jgi:hypothetical protein
MGIGFILRGTIYRIESSWPVLAPAERSDAIMPQSVRAKQLYIRWMEMWNGDLDAADEIFAADCVAHPAPTTTGEPQVYRGPDEMRTLVNQGRAIFGEVIFRALDEPIVDGARLACRWTGDGTYGGGMPGATATPGHGSRSAGSTSGKSRPAWSSSTGSPLTVST